MFAFLPITGGTPDPGDPAVVYLGDDRQQCTGTLITQYVVLTAAHCLVDGYRGLEVVVGPDASGARIAVVDGRAHPQWDPATGANDVGLVFLGAPVTGTAQALPVLALDAELPGASVRLVGYGETAGGADDGGIKRTGTATVSVVRPGELDLVAGPALACVGDSGGPVLLSVDGDEVIAGVISRGDGACGVSTTATRVDVHVADFILPYLEATAPGTAALYARCLYPEQCVTGVCVTARDEPLITYCAPTCTAGDAACPDGTECAPTGPPEVVSACQYVLPTPGAFGSPCADAAACVSGLCAAPADDLAPPVCTVRCVPGVATCPDPTACERVAGSEHACFPDAAAGCCSASGGGARSSGVLALLAGLLITRRRRRSGTRGSAGRPGTR